MYVRVPREIRIAHIYVCVSLTSPPVPTDAGDANLGPDAFPHICDQLDTECCTVYAHVAERTLFLT